jgi:thiol-disulfide isomerase/thioredoxin
MDPLIASVVLASLLVLTALLGTVLLRAPQRTKRLRGEEKVDPAELGVERLGADATVVQFSTEFCARCPSVKRTISELVGRYASVDFVHVDVSRNARLARKYRLVQSPTVLILDGGGAPRSRLSGAVTRQSVAEEIDALTGGPVAHD